jgi:hypothetical protein
MLREALVRLDAPLGDGFHQVDAAARRFGLEAEHPIGRALVEAETAMDALVKLG